MTPRTLHIQDAHSINHGKTSLCGLDSRYFYIRFASPWQVAFFMRSVTVRAPLYKRRQQAFSHQSLCGNCTRPATLVRAYDAY